MRCSLTDFRKGNALSSPPPLDPAVTWVGFPGPFIVDLVTTALEVLWWIWRGTPCWKTASTTTTISTAACTMSEWPGNKLPTVPAAPRVLLAVGGAVVAPLGVEEAAGDPGLNHHMRGLSLTLTLSLSLSVASTHTLHSVG